MNYRLNLIYVNTENTQILPDEPKWKIASRLLKGFKISDFESNTFDYVDKKADYKDASIFSQQTQKDLK